MMLKRKLCPGLLLVLLLALTSCGPRTLSSQDYKELVISTLQGKASEEGLHPLPGLIPSLKRLFDSLYCAEYNCGIAYEMNYAAEAAQRELYNIIEYRARICDSKRVRPAAEMQLTHEEICKILERIEDDIDALLITTRYAVKILVGYDDLTEAQEATKSFSRKIMELKGAIIEALRELQTIAWLAPIFEGVGAEIPELQTEKE